MNFLDAKKIVSPDSPVVPGSQEHQDILKLMRQSGRVFAEDNVLPVPQQLTSLRPFLDRPTVVNERKVSKRDWAQLSKYVSNNVSKGVVAKAQVRKPVFPSSVPTPGMSKKEWLNKISPVNIENGSDERGSEVQAVAAVEGGARPSEGSA
jgi:hypothetical protein